MKSIPKLLTAEELADLLRVSIKTVRNWTSAGKLPSVKLNGAVRYREDQIFDWLNENTRTAS